ncbi:uncharacterized protein LOC114518585 [Dendronephthya gigantea]|uniref:uncharacterized protein LOC114518585 n=1 Tax=Dendronephthya gigantea TaxID=151771 RepID=UPI00106A145E|nr:uncharacterized protein LOC114518585 [Dendronephthya gigantea]
MLMNERRSRYNKYIAKINYYHDCHIVNRDRRDRAPSRIPAKRFSRILCKSRSVRRLMRRYIKKEIPRSSHVHRILHASSHERKRLLSDGVMYLPQASLKKPKLLKVESGKVYSLTNAPVRLFNGKKQLTSTKNSNFREIQDEEMAKLEDGEAKKRLDEISKVKYFTIQRVKVIENIDRFLKCKRIEYQKKLQVSVHGESIMCNSCHC